MADQDTFKTLVDEAATLVREAANPRRRTLSLSPEVAAHFTAASPAKTAEKPAPPSADSGDWPTLEATVAACTQCALHERRNNTVFGVGSRQADVVFVGEAPGEQEDLQGEPFVGAAGKMLTDIIEKGMKMTRDDVFICNVLKCRPPGNRNPNAEEVALCEPYLQQQLALLQPKAICALGGVAAQTLLKTKDTVGSMRGHWHQYQGIPLRVTYHPSYIIRQRDPERLKTEKRKVWTDIQAVLRVLRDEETP
jgi:uracil-DNA glycosylase